MTAGLFAELGHFALWLALAVALAQILIPALGVWRNDTRPLAFARTAAPAHLCLIPIAFVSLRPVFMHNLF